MEERRQSRRRGTVLIIVVGILAVLMLLAATLALTSRIELKASRNYEYNQMLDRLAEEVQKYCADILARDKFGTSGVAYSFEKVASAPADGLYPRRWLLGTPDGLDGDNESFDSYDTDEFLARDDGGNYGCTEQWSMFNWRDAWVADPNLGAPLFADGLPCAVWKDVASILGEGNTLGGTNMAGTFAVYIRDVGGARIDINGTGNIMGLGGTPIQNQGLSPFESRLYIVTNALAGSSDSRARALIGAPLGRYGPAGLPGGLGDDNNLIGTINLDINGDGTVETVAIADESTEFIPENPRVDDAPFGPVDLFDLLWSMNSGSRVAAILFNGGASNDSIALDQLDAEFSNPKFSYFTTLSGGTILAPRSLRCASGGTTFAQTMPDPSGLGSHPFMRYRGGAWLSNSMGQDMMLRRGAHNGLRLSGTEVEKGTDAAALATFLQQLGPCVIIPDIQATELPNNNALLVTLCSQIATNLVDMLDTDSRTLRYGAAPPYYTGVDVTPYVAEVDAAVDTSAHPFLPNLDGTLPAPGTRARTGPTLWKDTNDPPTGYDAGDAVWVDNNKDGLYNAAADILLQGAPAENDTGIAMTPTPQDKNNPPTGWGKYIKLVNPWNVDLDLGSYSLIIPAAGLRKWVWNPATGRWVSQQYTTDLRIDFAAGDTIPARGHYLIVDNAAAGGPFAAMPVGIRKEVPVINYMQECADGTIAEADDSFVGGPTIIDLFSEYGAADQSFVMRFCVQETPTTAPCPAEGEDDRDDWPVGAANYSTQIDDPRPCWVRETDGDGIVEAMATATDYSQWAMGVPHATQERTYVDWGPGTNGTTTKELGWFNRNWRGTSDTDAIGSGDNWFKLYNAGGALGVQPNNADNLLCSFPPVNPDDYLYSGVVNKFIKVMNIGGLPTPGYIGFVHAGIPWGTVSLTSALVPSALPDLGRIGAADLVYLRNFTDYLTGPFSPFENGQDDDGDGISDDDGTSANDRCGPEIRLRGRMNVNTAPHLIMRAAFDNDWLGNMWTGSGAGIGRINYIINAIETRRRAGANIAPFSSIDDLMDRMPEIFEMDLDGNDAADANMPNSFRREALARFMYNMLTVRTDVYSVVARVRLYESNALVAERGMFLVFDRSYDPVQLILNRELPY